MCIKSTKVRTLKVYQKTIIYHTGFANSVCSYFPEIRLMGKWLADCGFQAGQYVDITTEQNKLTITLSWPYNEEADLKTTEYEKQKTTKIKAMAEGASGKTCKP